MTAPGTVWFWQQRGYALRYVDGVAWFGKLSKSGAFTQKFRYRDGAVMMLQSEVPF